MKRQGMTLVELIVVIICLLIVVSILLPLHRGDSEKGRQTVCCSHVRQLATAVEMYAQDNKGRYPGSNWANAIYNYVGSQKIYFCPIDMANDKVTPISYGYSGLLVRPDGKGVNEAQVLSPTEVGAIADATPTRAWKDGGGLIGGGALMNPTDPATNNIVELEPRHNGINVGFCDGHAKFFPGKSVNPKDISSGPGRAFYQAAGLGLVWNYGGGLNAIPCHPTKKTVIIGGDYAGMPLLNAAADVWAAKGGKWSCQGFKGVGSPDLMRAKATKHYAWIDAGDSVVGTPVAQDALVLIVAKNCKIPNFIPNAGGDYVVTSADLVRLFGSPSAADRLQVYSYDAQCGNRTYFAEKLRGWGAAKGLEFGVGAVAAENDPDMVDKVAADPYGIGYCSAVFVDTDKVTILGINGKLYPNQNPKYRWVVPDTTTVKAGEFEYPLIRTLYLRTGGDGARMVPVMQNPKFLAGPLFTTSYFKP